MNIAVQLGMFAIGACLFFSLGGLFIKKVSDDFFIEMFSKGSAFFFLLIFIFNYHLNLPIKSVCILPLILGVLGVVRFALRCVQTSPNITIKQNAINIILFLGGVLFLAQTVFFKTLNPWLDSYTYVNCADHMMEHGWKEVIQYQEYYPWTTQVQWYQDWGLRVGGQQLMAFLTAICGELSFEALIPSTAIGTILTGCALVRIVCVLARKYFVQIDGSCFIAEILVSLWSGFSGLLFCDSFGGYYPMTLGSAFFLLALSEILVGLTSDFEMENLAWATVYASCLAITYSELLPFFVIQVICLLGYEILKERKVFNEFTKFIAGVGALSAVVLNVYVIDAVRAVLLEMQDKVGDSSRGRDILEWLGYLLGTLPALYTFHNAEDGLKKALYLLITVIFGVGAILCTAYYLKEHMVKIVVLYLPFIVMLIYFNYFAPNLWEEGMGNSYSVYKTMRYFALIIFPVLAIAVSQYYYDNKWRHNKSIVFVYCMIIIGIGTKDIINTYEKMRVGNAQITGNYEDNFVEYYELREKYREEERTINLVGLPDAHARLVSYFLKDCKLAFPMAKDVFYWRWVEKDPEYDAEGLTLLYENSPEAIAGLIEMPSNYYQVSLEEGFYAEEALTNGKYKGAKFCWSKKNSFLEVKRPVSFTEDNLELEFYVFLWDTVSDANLYISDATTEEEICKVHLDANGLEDPIAVKVNLDMTGLLQRKLEIRFKGEAYEGERELAYLILLDDNIQYDYK